MKTSNIYVRVQIDAEVKEQAAATLSEIGLSISDAIRLLMIRIADEHCLPFEIKSSKAISEESIAKPDTGKGIHFKNIEQPETDLSLKKGSPLALLAALKAHPLPESSRLSDAEIDAQVKELLNSWE
jgi:DNA-damage-inducible protein J